MRARRLILSVFIVVVGVLAFASASALAAAPEAYVTEVTSDSATLHATLDPEGSAMTYRFEYGSTGAYGSQTPEASVGEGSTPVSVEAHLQGLSASSVYHFRVVAVNAAHETFESEDQTFTTQQNGEAFSLLDGRRYEMVSPPEKQGALISAISEQNGLVEAAADGGAVTYVSNVPTETGSVGFADTVQNLSTRGSAGWQTRDLTVPHAQESGPSVGWGPEYRFFSTDLASAIVQPLGQFTSCESAEGVAQPCMSPEASEETAFLTTNFFNGDTGEQCLPESMHCARPLVSGCPPVGEACPRIVEEHADVPPGTVFGGLYGGEYELSFCLLRNARYCGPHFVAATPDLSHVLLAAEARLTPEAPSSAPEGEYLLYEWSAGKLTYVGEGEVGGGRGAGEGAREGYVDPISADGSRVVFYHPAIGRALLMRDTATAETVEISKSGSEFQVASSDDSRVFLDESGELSVFEVTSGAGAPLAGRVTSLTDGMGLVGSVLGASEDGSYVYFVSNGVLASGAMPGTCKRAQNGSEEGVCNLYVDHYNGSEWKPTFIAALSGEDYFDWRPEIAFQEPVRVSPDGQWLAFMSAGSLTGYDNHDASNGRPDAEVYLYHASTGGGASTLTCASCDPTGARPTGVEYSERETHLEFKAAWLEESMVAADLPGWQEAAGSSVPEDYQSRYLSDGGRLFFNSFDPLVPDDVGGTEEVYEYEPEGTGDCTPAVSSGGVVFEPAREFDAQDRRGEQGAGCVGLVSSGTSNDNSVFLDASETGGDVFFLTSAKLASQDLDSAYDVYDAHECSGSSPCLSAPVSPPACETEASCKAPPTPQPPIYGAPPSATFNGPGNLAPLPSPSLVKVAKKTVKCGKGLVKNGKGKCVKRVRKKSKKAKRSNRGAGR
jgi:hypothetical protein